MFAGQHYGHDSNGFRWISGILAAAFHALIVIIDLEENILSFVLDGSEVVLSMGIIGLGEGIKEADFLKHRGLIDWREGLDSLS